MKQYSMDKCAGNVLKTTQFTSGVCLNATILTLLGATSSSDTSGYDSGYGSSGYKSCFAGSETLYVESRGATLISDIRVGDRVLAADAAGLTLYSDVVFVPHGTNEDNALFVHITTANDRDIKMTESHILPSGACNAASSLPLVYAKHVKVGDCVMTVSGMERVSAVETVKGQGLYTIVTKDEYVVVNGIIASPFAYNHMMASMYYNMHRFFYTSAPALLRSPLIQATNEVSPMKYLSNSYLKYL